MKYLLALLLCASLAMVAPAAQAMAAPAYVPVTHEADSAPEPVVALLLELLLPGLGMIYNGETGTGLLYMGIWALVCLLAIFGTIDPFWGAVLCGIRIFGIIAVTIDAHNIKTKALQPHDDEPKDGEQSSGALRFPGPKPVSWAL